MSSSSRRRKESEKKNQGGCYLSTAFGALVVVLLCEWLWPAFMPFTIFQFWVLKAPIWEVLLASLPIFAWGIGVNIVYSLKSRNDPEINRYAERILPIGCGISLWAGVMEEICFRWLIFMDEIIGYKIINWLIFGWAGFGLFEWFFLHIAGPVANFLTLGYLAPILFNGLGWAVGAAVISANGKFRDGHEYQGLFGWINSWFIGMFMFFLMFQYGLIASIVVHFLYDMFIFVVRYLDAAVERKMGWI